MKIKKILLILIIGFVFLLVQQVYAFDIKDYFNYDILSEKLRGAESVFQQSDFSVQNQELFQKLSGWLYQATGINLIRIWLDASGLVIAIFRWIADFLVSLR